jgi:hypothetical protein
MRRLAARHAQFLVGIAAAAHRVIGLSHTFVTTSGDPVDDFPSWTLVDVGPMPWLALYVGLILLLFPKPRAPRGAGS